MALRKPDIIEHNNPSLAIADSDFVRGGVRTPVADTAALLALASKVDQLKEGSTQVWVISEGAYFMLIDIDEVGAIEGWQRIGNEGYVDLDTSGATVVIDMLGRTERRFKATDDVSGDKDWSIINAEAALEIPSIILTTTVSAPVQTFGAGFKMGNSNDWDFTDGAWSPLEAGEYDLRFTFQGGIWRIVPSGPFY